MSISDRGAGRGFTMVELVLALAIAGILAAVAAPRLMDRSAFQARGAAAEIRTALRLAQKLAMTKNREVCVGLAATSVALTLNPAPIPGAACSTAVTRPGSNDPYTVNLPAGTTLVPALGFRFDPLGRPSPNVNLALTVAGLPVTVARETGYVQ